MRRFIVALTAASLLATACSDDSSSQTSDAPLTTPSTLPSTTEVVDSTVDTTVAPTTVEPTVAPTTPPETFDDRPFEVFVPSGYDAATAAPLVILLHGYGATGAIQDFYFNMQPQAEARGFLYAFPDGTPNQISSNAWNATNACCHDDDSVDDSGYLTFIIDDVSSKYNVDPSRIFLVGHSNGGFMSYRMACEHADRIAGIVSLAGATFIDTAQCAPTEPVNILQIHGTDDGTIAYDGGSTPLGTYPSAETTVAKWSAYNGCTTTIETLGTIDFNLNVDGVETTMTAFTGCPVDGAVELWTMADSPHIPALHSTFAADIIDWLFAHPNA